MIRPLTAPIPTLPTICSPHVFFSRAELRFTASIGRAPGYWAGMELVVC
jgi:hypothetical protein